MKKIKLLLSALILFAAFAIGQAQPQAPFIKNVDAKTFKGLAESGKGITLDVRTPEEVAGGYINNASTINFYDPDFEKKINLMAKDKEIYVYCRSGGRSAKAADLLQKNGFAKVYNLDGGIMSWQNNNFPLVKPTGAKDEKIQQLSMDEFKKMINTAKPVLVDFHTLWCSPCKQMAPVVDKLETQYKGKAVVMRVDVDKSLEVSKAYNISGVPVFILFKNSKEVWRHKGLISEEELKKELDKNVQ
jgi:thioredoxin 1